jgi:hypothetical protein
VQWHIWGRSIKWLRHPTTITHITASVMNVENLMGSLFICYIKHLSCIVCIRYHLLRGRILRSGLVIWLDVVRKHKLCNIFVQVHDTKKVSPRGECCWGPVFCYLRVLCEKLHPEAEGGRFPRNLASFYHGPYRYLPEKAVDSHRCKGLHSLCCLGTVRSEIISDW